MLFPETLGTDRLHLERLHRENVDVFEYHRCCSSREPGIEAVTRYLPWDAHDTVKETSDRMNELEDQWENGTRAEYVIRPKNGEPGAGDIAGSAGLILEWDRHTAMPAIWLRRRFWGRGYSGERAAGLLSLAFDRLDLDVVAIPVQQENERSIRAVERYVDAHGGQYDGLVRNAAVRPDGSIIDHRRYTITRDQYLSRSTA